jgi:hypothetical protein
MLFCVACVLTFVCVWYVCVVCDICIRAVSRLRSVSHMCVPRDVVCAECHVVFTCVCVFVSRVCVLCVSSI